MISTNLTRSNAFVWSGYFPTGKRVTRKGKIIFTAIDGSGEKTYISTGTFTSIDEFYKHVYRNQLENNNV